MSLLLEWGRTMEVSRAYSNLLKRECNLSSQFLFEKVRKTFKIQFSPLAMKWEIPIILGQTHARNWQFCHSAFRFSCRCRSRVERCRGHVERKNTLVVSKMF